jgi:hypothetical protein
VKQYYKTDIMAQCRESVFPAVFEPEHDDIVIFYSGGDCLELGRVKIGGDLRQVERISPLPSISPFAAKPKTSFFEYYASSSFLEVVTYKFLDEDMNALCRSLPLESLREMFALEKVDHFANGPKVLSAEEDFVDFTGNPVRVGDMVAYHNGPADLKIGRVSRLDRVSHRAILHSANWSENSYAGIEPRFICVLPNSDENREVIADMTDAQVMDFYSPAKREVLHV